MDEWELEDEDNQKDEDNWYSTKSKYQNHEEIASNKSYKRYEGAIVLDPVRGLHHEVYFFGVTSLYPSMIVKYDLSPETVNCSCCKKDLGAKETVSSEILKDCSHIPAKDGAVTGYASAQRDCL